MFGIGIQEVLLILVVAFLVAGADRLPKITRALGKGLAELKKGLSEDPEENEDCADNGRARGNI